MITKKALYTGFFYVCAAAWRIAVQSRISYHPDMNMFTPVAAKTVAAYLDALPAERKAIMKTAHAFIRKTVPALRVHFASNMIGYGSFPYLNYKKERIQWPIIALASQKQHVSLYVCALERGKYLAETHKAELGKVQVGKSCIRFKKWEDVDLDGLARVLKAAEAHPGLRAE